MPQGVREELLLGEKLRKLLDLAKGNLARR